MCEIVWSVPFGYDKPWKNIRSLYWFWRMRDETIWTQMMINLIEEKWLMVSLTADVNLKPSKGQEYGASAART